MKPKRIFIPHKLSIWMILFITSCLPINSSHPDSPTRVLQVPVRTPTLAVSITQTQSMGITITQSLPIIQTNSVYNQTPTLTAVNNIYIYNPKSELPKGLYFAYTTKEVFWIRGVSGGINAQLKLPPTQYFKASYAPKRNIVAFINNNQQLSIFDFASSTTQILPTAQDIVVADYPDWSSDEKRIIYLGYIYWAEGWASIYQYDYDKQENTRLSCWDREFSPEWSPNGEWLAFTSNQSKSISSTTNALLYLIERKNIKPCFTLIQQGSDEEAMFPTWSSDNKSIAYVCTVEGNYGICIVDINNLSEKKFYKIMKETVLGLSWSPDGEYIAFTAGIENHGADIYFLQTGDGSIMNITNTPNQSEEFSFWVEVK